MFSSIGNFLKKNAIFGNLIISVKLHAFKKYTRENEDERNDDNQKTNQWCSRRTSLPPCSN